MRLTGTGRGLTASVTALALVASAGAAALAADVGSTNVNVTDTSVWTPPSPDPSGITYIPTTDQLLVSDAEVDEIVFGPTEPGGYQGVNLYTMTRGGSLTATGTTKESATGWSVEPTGLSYGDGSMYVVDDDKKSVFTITSAGGDGVYGTADDQPATPKGFKTSTFGATDPEGVAYDGKRKELLLINGQTGARFYRLTAGVNGVFDGVYPGGDDVATEYDLTRYGVQDPEGIAYDAVRDTILVSSDGSAAIFELDHNGSLLNTIDIKDMGAKNAADVVIAPSSTGGGRSYYLVDRGLDNNGHPGENDGKVFEIKANLGPITNLPPVADAGVDQMLDRGETVTMTGAGLDGDGEALTYRWTATGPGTATIATPNAATTTATFSAVGDYVFRLTVRDPKGATGWDEATVRVFAPGAARDVALPVLSGTDDAQEGGGGSGNFVEVDSADNELGNTGGANPNTVLTGIRFGGLPVPKGAEIVGASIQFKVDEGSSGPASFTIVGEASDNATTYLKVGGNISSRPKTTASVSWSPPAWTAPAQPNGGDAGPDQRTPDLKTILQEVVDRPGWKKGNAAAFMISGSGRRTAEAKDGLTPPVLMLSFKTAVPRPLSLVASTGMVRSGERVILSGASDQASVELQARRGGGAWESLGTRVPDATGAYSMVDRPRVNTRYRALAGVEQSTVSLVKVRPGLRAWIKHSAVRSGTPTVVGGRVMPALAGEPLLLQRLAGSQWKTMKRQKMAADGPRSYRFKIVPRGTGTKRYRVVAPPYGSRVRAIAPGSASGLAVDVYRGAIRRVNVRKNVVVLRNTGGVAVNLKGWKVRNASSGTTRRIRQFELLPGRIVRLRSGRGRSDANDLYLGRPLVFWPGSTAEVRDRRGHLIGRR